MATLYSTALAALAPVVDNGVLPGDPRVAYRLDEAQRRLINQYNFISRREESLEDPLVWNAGGTIPGSSSSALILDDIDSTKLMILAAYREENNQLEMAEGLEKRAFGYIERDVIDQVERARYTTFEALTSGDQNTFGGITGRLGLEIFSSYKMPQGRVQSFINQAYQQAIDHFNFVVRTEQYELTPLSYTALVNPTDTFASSAITSEIVRGLALALIVQNSDTETQYTSGKELQQFKQDSLQLIERNVAAIIEKTRRDFGGNEGRLANELPEGTKIASARLTQYLSQAETEIMTHRAFLQRREDYFGLVPKITYEEKKCFVASYVASSRGQDQPAAELKKQGMDLVERNVQIAIESGRTANRKALAASDPTTFGFHYGRLGLEIPEGSTLSDEQLKRAVNTAEEQLLQSGKWVGTVGTYTLDITSSGEVFLPRAIETVLFACFDSNPQPVYDRYNEWLSTGSGLRTEENPWRYAFIDRGEAVDPADEFLKRKYFISFPGSQAVPPVVTVLAKNRFLPHSNDTDTMFLRNYQAVAQAAKALLSDGKLGSFDEAKKYLAQQIDQQFFRQKPSTPHTYRMGNFR